MSIPSYTAADLADFIAQHARPYRPESDAYRRPPFAAPVRAKRSGTIYNAHTYHTKVPPEGIVSYIEHYTEPGDLVLDPFCGSGMTGVAGLMTGRHVILNDLSPAATHIAYNYCTPVDVEALKREFERIQAAVKDEFDWLYGTTCDRCGRPATIQYTIWSDVFECGRCGAELVLWDVVVDRQTGKVQETFTCPNCDKEQTKRDVRWLHCAPVVTNYECSHCKPKRDEHNTTEAEKMRIAEIETESIPYWRPAIPFDESWEMWRGVHGQQGVTDTSKFYTYRNLRALARIWFEIGEVEDTRVASALRFIFTAFSMKHATKMTSMILKGGSRPVLTGNQPGTLYLPSLSVEKNVMELWQRKGDDIIEALKELSGIPINSMVLVKTSNAAKLREVADNVVDYVFTDPPFGSNIFYADCNLIWEAWLGQFTDQTHEAVVHVKHKNKNTLPDYARLMTDAFREMQRVLKPGRWASVVFHNSDDKIWQTILDAAEAAGFELAEINSFDKAQLSFKGIRGAKGLERVTNKDIVLNLHKPAGQSSRASQAGAASPTGDGRGNGDSEIRIVERIVEYLASNPPPEARTLQALWNTALGEMLRAGLVEVSMQDVDGLLPHYFKQVDGRWYLRGEAVLGGNVFDVKTDAGAIAWLTAVLGQPQTSGDLIPQWQKLTAQSGAGAPGRLERLLAQNFWLDKRSGQWRVPTAAERDAMSAQGDLKAEAHLRVVRRFLQGQLPQTPTARELAAWLQFCYSRGAYREAAELFQRLDAAQIEDEWYRQLKRMAAVCQARVQAETPD